MVSPSAPQMRSEILSFNDQNPGYDYHVPSQPDATFGQADSNDDSLQNFFKRPIKIQSFGWGTGTTIYEKFNPWTDFWENPRVVARITNFNLLRCKLCVKFVLNGNGFHYGRLIASYIPLDTADTFTKDRTFVIEDVVEASQRPHLYLDPTNSQGGTMCLPFVYPENAMDIPNNEWDEMGSMIIHTLQGLKHANGATDSVTVSVFAWAEDVVFSIPTAAEPQAGEYVPQADEYGDGIASRPAGMIARAAGMLAKAPIIGPYARATEMGASTIASIAKMFGYSRPNVLSDIQPYRPTYMGNLANTNYPDSATKLTFDAKQELTCDTRTFGLDGTDEMSLKSIATRESFLTQFAWAETDAAESHLWATEVNPVVWSELTVGDNVEYHMPACCFAALPFKHWRCSMRYRFQIVASAFHKGRIKIVYDPNYPVTNEYNTNYTRIVDLAEERDFVVEVGWGQQYPYLLHRSMINGAGEIFKPTPFTADPAQLANGILSIRVINELTTPNSTVDNSVSVNVFVAAGDDFEVANPDWTYVKNLSWYEPQFGEYVPQSGEASMPDSDNTQEESAPVMTTTDEQIAPELSVADHTMDVFFGDPVTSIRQVIKRYNFSKYIPTDDAEGTGALLVSWILNNLPLHRGFVTDGTEFAQDSLAIAQPYNFTRMTMMNYYMPAYVCYRGGVKWKYHMLVDTGSAANNTGANFMSVVRNASAPRDYGQQSTVLSANGTDRSGQVATWAGAMPSFHDGGHATVVDQNPVVEVEIPFQQNRRFGYGKQSLLNLTRNALSFYHELLYKAVISDTTRVGVLSYVAAGEDFTLGFYTGPPVAYYQPEPTPAATPP